MAIIWLATLSRGEMEMTLACGIVHQNAGVGIARA